MGVQFKSRNKKIQKAIEMSHLIGFLEATSTSNDERREELKEAVKSGLITQAEAYELFAEFRD